MAGNAVDEGDWAVTFVNGPGQFAFGDAVQCVLRLDYFPEVQYVELIEGASFTVREGARIVAHGVVLERREVG